MSPTRNNIRDFTQGAFDTVRLLVIGVKGFGGYTVFERTLDRVLPTLGWSAAHPDHGLVLLTGSDLDVGQMISTYAFMRRIVVDTHMSQITRFSWDSDGMVTHKREASDEQLITIVKDTTHLIAFWDGRDPEIERQLNLASNYGLDVLTLVVDH